MSQSIGKFATQAILCNQNAKNSEILQLVQNEFPNAKTSINCIAWYRNKIKKDNIQLQVQQVRTSETVATEIELLQVEMKKLQEQEKEATEKNKDQLMQQFETLKKQLGL